MPRSITTLPFVARTRYCGISRGLVSVFCRVTRSAVTTAAPICQARPVPLDVEMVNRLTRALPPLPGAVGHEFLGGCGIGERCRHLVDHGRGARVAEADALVAGGAAVVVDGVDARRDDARTFGRVARGVLVAADPPEPSFGAGGNSARSGAFRMTLSSSTLSSTLGQVKSGAGLGAEGRAGRTRRARAAASAGPDRSATNRARCRR